MLGLINFALIVRILLCSRLLAVPLLLVHGFPGFCIKEDRAIDFFLSRNLLLFYYWVSAHVSSCLALLLLSCIVQPTSWNDMNSSNTEQCSRVEWSACLHHVLASSRRAVLFRLLAGGMFKAFPVDSLIHECMTDYSSWQR